MLLITAGHAHAQDSRVVVGSKMDGESYLLAEIASQLLESNGFEVERKFGFGGTLICYNALQEGEIDIYPEYTGTISEAILSPDERPDDTRSITSYQDILRSKNLDLFSQFGFNNSYVIAIKGELADKRNIETISDLAAHTDLVMAYSHEFLNRSDGWESLKETYGLDFSPTGIQHGLAYKAIDDGAINITDAYSTDGDIERYGLIFLEDDLEFFPKYYAALLSRTDFPEEAKRLLLELENTLTENDMRAMNAQVVIEQRSFADVASEFLNSRGFVEGRVGQSSNIIDNLITNTVTHIKLTLIALSIGCLVGLAAAFMIFRSQSISRYVIYFTGLLQTIPSIALLALMIPLLGIGEVPAIVALFLYSLLPILRGAVTALSTIDPVLTNVSRAIGMTRVQQLRYVLFPMALPNILSGIKTAAVICIGTATLAAFIGAGGLGEPIVTGLALNDTSLILQGAIPAACLAILVEILFELLEKYIVPAHMRTAN